MLNWYWKLYVFVDCFIFTLEISCNDKKINFFCYFLFILRDSRFIDHDFKGNVCFFREGAIFIRSWYVSNDTKLRDKLRLIIILHLQVTLLFELNDLSLSDWLLVIVIKH